MSGKRLTLTAIALATVLIAAGCRLTGEVRDESFADHAAAAASGLIDRGWIPELLPPSATAIHLNYDIDTNEAVIAFAYDSTGHEALVGSCATTPHVPSPTIETDWLPPTVALDADHSYTCDDGFLVTNGETAYHWTDEAALTINDLDDDPERYRFLDGEIAAVIGYVDFGNIHDRRDTYYGEEVIGFVLKPGQYAEMVVGAVFPNGVDPHPLFDDIYAHRPADEADGLRLMVTGRLGLYEQPTNFTTDLGWGIDVADPADVVILDSGT